MTTTNPAHLAWARNVHAMLKEGGAWGVPRSGLVFRREGERMILVFASPEFDPNYQRGDYEAIQEHFSAAGIPVFAAHGVMDAMRDRAEALEA